MELWAIWSSGRCPCSWQGGWNQMIFKVPSNPYHTLWGHDFCRGPTHPNSVGRVLRGSAVTVGSAWEHTCAWKNSILDHRRTKNCSGQNLYQQSRKCLIWQEFLQVDKPETKLMRYTQVSPRCRLSSWLCQQNRAGTCRSRSHLTTHPLSISCWNCPFNWCHDRHKLTHLLAQSVSAWPESHRSS